MHNKLYEFAALRKNIFLNCTLLIEKILFLTMFTLHLFHIAGTNNEPVCTPNKSLKKQKYSLLVVFYFINNQSICIALLLVV